MAGTEDTAPERPSTSSCLGTIITLLGAIGGYVGVLAVLVRPVGVTALWLQLLGSNLVTDNGAVWYAAWKAPTTTIIRNFLYIIAWSPLPAFLISSLSLIFQRSLFSQKFRREFSGRNDRVNIVLTICFSGILMSIVFTGLATAIVAPTSSTPSFLFNFAKLWPVITIPSMVAGLLVGSIGGLLPIRVRPSDEVTEEATPPQRRRRVFSSLIVTYVASILVAAYLTGLQDPNLPYIQYESPLEGDAKQKEVAILLSYSEGYWYVFDCRKRFLALHNNDVRSVVITTNASHHCEKEG